jgi:hypothetical protein
MKRLLAFLLIAVLLAGAVGTSAFAAPGNSGKVHWKDQLIMDWDAMMQEYLELKDELEDEGSLNRADQARYDDLVELLTTENKMAKKFYLALRNHLSNKHYAAQPYVQDAVSVMNRFRHRFENWDVLPFNSIISHKYNFLFDTPPMLADGRTLVPIRGLAEGLGVEDEDIEWIPYWDDDALTFGDFEGFSSKILVDDFDVVDGSQTADEWLDEKKGSEIDEDTKVSVVRISKDDIQIALFIDFPVAYVDEDDDIRWEALDTMPQVFDGRTYVPLRFILQTYNLTALWDDGTIIIDDDDDDDDPILPSDIERDDDEVRQDPYTLSRYKLDVDFDPTDYDVVVRSVDGNDDGTSIDKMVYFDEEIFGGVLDGYYVGLAIDVPNEVDEDNYLTNDVVDVEWANEDVEVYAVVGDELYVYLPVTEAMEGSSPNLEVKWELGLDKETFDVKLQYLRFADEPIEEMEIERENNDVTQYGDVGGVDLDFDFDEDDKELFIDGDEAEVAFIDAADPLPAEAGNYVGIRIEAPDDFEEEDLEYVEFEGNELDADEFDINDNRLVYYLEIKEGEEAEQFDLTIKWAPEYIEETIEIRWVDFTLEAEILVPERAEDSVRQDPEETGGLGLDYDFDLEANELEIETADGRSVAYYQASEGELVDLDDVALEDGNWVGIEILNPTNYDGETIKELTIGQDTWTDLELDGDDNDRLWFYFQAEEGYVDLELEILWADNFEEETIVIDAAFFELADVPTE